MPLRHDEFLKLFCAWLLFNKIFHKEVVNIALADPQGSPNSADCNSVFTSIVPFQNWTKLSKFPDIVQLFKKIY